VRTYSPHNGDSASKVFFITDGKSSAFFAFIIFIVIDLKDKIFYTEKNGTGGVI